MSRDGVSAVAATPTEGVSGESLHEAVELLGEWMDWYDNRKGRCAPSWTTEAFLRRLADAQGPVQMLPLGGVS